MIAMARAANIRPAQISVSANDDVIPDELIWLEGEQTYIACAFYTENYRPQVMSLRSSLQAHRINHFLKRYDHAGTWEKTTRIKPVFLSLCMDRFPDKDVLYVDADAVVRCRMDFLDTVTSDVSLCFLSKTVRNRLTLRASAGTVFIRNTDGGRKFVSLWSAASSRCKPLADDEDLIAASLPAMEGVSISVLPASYYKVFDSKKLISPVIEHFQASRSQFKWTKAMKIAKRYATALLGLTTAGLVMWVALRG